jgi:hypothetical protein
MNKRGEKVGRLRGGGEKSRLERGEIGYEGVRVG